MKLDELNALPLPLQVTPHHEELLRVWYARKGVPSPDRLLVSVIGLRDADAAVNATLLAQTLRGALQAAAGNLSTTLGFHYPSFREQARVALLELLEEVAPERAAPEYARGVRRLGASAAASLALMEHLGRRDESLPSTHPAVVAYNRALHLLPLLFEAIPAAPKGQGGGHGR